MTQAPNTYTEKRLERAVAHVSDYWVPVNSALLGKIQNGLSQGTYDQNLDALLLEVRSDVSLYCYCLRKLLHLVKESNLNLDINKSPTQLMLDAGIEQLKQILNVDALEISEHRLDQATALQTARIKESVLSASSAQVLSDAHSIDADTAYSAALLRQLGHTLIAWNYPEIYQHAMATLKSGKELDILLTKHLGFSPMLLAMRLLNSWGMDESACANLGLRAESEPDEEAQILNAVSDRLVRICQVSEALARANDPYNYPDALDEWHYAKREIETELGPQAMELIADAFKSNSENYLEVLPEIFNAGLIVEEEFFKQQSKQYGVRLRNPFITLCANEVQEQLIKLYSNLDNNSVSKDNLRALVREVVPLTEYFAGCIYTIDPGLFILVPQLEIGKATLRQIEPVDYSIVGSNADLLAVAYQSDAPVLEYRKNKKAQICTAVAGIFGKSQRVGVLYLEALGDLSNHHEAQHMQHFKALACALNDCLNLE